MDKHSDFFSWLVPGQQESTKGGPGSGNFGHTGRPGKKGGSGKGEEGQHHGPRAENLIGIAERTGGFSYNPNSESIPHQGMILSIYPERGVAIKGRKIKGDDIRDYISKNEDLWKSNPQVHVGGWIDTINKEFDLDMSVIVKTHEEAVSLCKKHKQKAYYDLKRGVEVWVDENAKNDPEEKEVKKEAPKKELQFMIRPDKMTDADYDKMAEGLNKRMEELFGEKLPDEKAA